MAKLGFIEQNFGLKLTEQTCLILKKLPYDPDFVSIFHLVTLSKFQKLKYVLSHKSGSASNSHSIINTPLASKDISF